MNPCYCKHPKPSSEGICKVCKGAILVKPKKDTKKETNLVKENEKLREENESLKKRLRTVEIEGWKSRDKILIEKIGSEWVIQEHRKDKLTSEMATIIHRIPEQNVGVLWDILLRKCPTIGTGTTYRKIIPSIIETYHLPIEIDAYNGGKNRKTYFETYYFCVKILESLGWIKYGGRGRIVRLV